MAGIRNVVLVHGGFVDGSGWQGVYDLLTADGFNVSIVQNPTLSLEGDVSSNEDGARRSRRTSGARRTFLRWAQSSPNQARTKRWLHSVYITAFAPDKEESVQSLISGFPTGGPQPPILPASERLPTSRPRKVQRRRLQVYLPAHSRPSVYGRRRQVPWGLDAHRHTQFTDLGSGDPKPSWYLVVTRGTMSDDSATCAAHHGGSRPAQPITETPGQSHDPMSAHAGRGRQADSSKPASGAQLRSSPVLEAELRETAPSTGTEDTWRWPAD